MAEKEQEKRVYVRPVANIWEENGKVILKLEMPGVQKESLDIKVDNEELKIHGARPNEAAKGSYIIRERKKADFFQSFTLDETIDKERIDAFLEKGILTLTLHMKESVKPKKIEVKAG